MNKFNLLQKIAIFVATGVVSIIETSMTPVQAFVFIRDSTLGWQSQTNNFFRNIPQNLVDGDTFDITFNSNFPNIFVTSATGSFASAFDLPFDTLADSPVGPVTFQYDEIKGRYILQDDLTWDFGSRVLTNSESISENGILLWTIPVKTEFLVSFETSNSVEIDLFTDSFETFPYFTFNGNTYGALLNSRGEIVMNRFQDTLASTFQFSDLSTAAPGNYSVNSLVTPISEPVTIFGLLISGVLALGLKSKK